MAESSLRGNAGHIVAHLQKSPRDKCEYRYIRLKNSLEVLLIQNTDPDVKTAAASINVGVGSHNDPESMKGLAHAVEHAIFQGSKNNPKQNAVKIFIDNNGGSLKAVTALRNTMFSFETHVYEQDPDGECGAFFKALGMMADALSYPLFNETSVSGELTIIDSEKKSIGTRSGNRKQNVDFSLMNPKHINSKTFPCGDSKTLAGTPAELAAAARKLWENGYCAGRTHVAVMAPMGLDEMQSKVADLFRHMPNRGLGEPEPRLIHPWHWHSEPDADRLSVTIKGTDPFAYLAVQFCLEARDDDCRTYTTGYVIDLLRRTGPESLSYALKKQGWCDDISTRLGDNAEGYAILEVFVHVTPEGKTAVQDIVRHILMYFSFLRIKGPQEWLHDEKAMSNKLQFDRHETLGPLPRVIGLTLQMRLPYAREQLLKAPTVPCLFNPAGIKLTLNKLTADNMRVVMVDPDCHLANPQKEKHFGVEFDVSPIQESVMGVWRSASNAVELSKIASSGLGLPEKNGWIPDEAPELRTTTRGEVSSKRLARLLRDESGLRLWLLQRNRHEDTISYVNIRLLPRRLGSTPQEQHNAKDVAALNLFNSLVEDELTSVLSGAREVGADVDMYCDHDGFQFHLRAYPAKAGGSLLITKLLKTVLSTAKNPQLTDEAFKRCKDRLSVWYGPTALDDPLGKQDRLTWELLTERATYEEKLAAIKEMDMKEMEKIVKSLFQEVGHVDMLAGGNMDEALAVELADTVRDIVQPKEGMGVSTPLGQRNYVIPAGKHMVFSRVMEGEKDDENSLASRAFFPAKSRQPDVMARLDLLQQLMTAPAFDFLRTQQKDGYIVKTQLKKKEMVASLGIAVQTTRKTCAAVLENIDLFLRQFSETLKTMPAREFETAKKAAHSSWTKPSETAEEEMEDVWGPILSGSYNFDRCDKVGNEVLGISQTDLVDFYMKLFHSPQSGQLTMMLFSPQAADQMPCTDDDTSGGVVVTDIEAFRESLQLSEPASVETVFEQYK